MKESTNKTNSKKSIDLMMVILFAITLFTGIKLHMAGHSASHEVWECWAIAHSIVAVFMTAAIGAHVWQHWSWYKALTRRVANKKAARRRWMVLALTATMTFIIASGIVLLAFIYTTDSHLGLIHYMVGLLAFVLIALHLSKRYKFLIPK